MRPWKTDNCWEFTKEQIIISSVCLHHLIVHSSGQTSTCQSHHGLYQVIVGKTSSKKRTRKERKCTEGVVGHKSYAHHSRNETNH